MVCKVLSRFKKNTLGHDTQELLHLVVSYSSTSHVRGVVKGWREERCVSQGLEVVMRDTMLGLALVASFDVCVLRLVACPTLYRVYPDCMESK